MPLTTVFSRYLELAAKTAPAVKAAIDETCKEIEQDVKGGVHAAPIRTGNLRRSYHTEFVSENPARPEAQVGNDMDIADYAAFVEFGTYKMAAQPHLTPATEAQRAPHAARVAAAVKEAQKL